LAAGAPGRQPRRDPDPAGEQQDGRRQAIAGHSYRDPRIMTDDNRFLPERAPIDSYGNSGFRFAAMSHQGSLLILANGMHAWRPGGFAEVTLADFAQVLTGA